MERTSKVVAWVPYAVRMAEARAVQADDEGRVVRRLDLAQVVYVCALSAFVLALVTIDVAELRSSFFGWDFRAFYDGGRDYLHLRSPYVSASLANLTSHQNFVYPLPTAALFAPISLLPYHVAAGLFIVLEALLLGGAVYLLGVRDVRCYGAILIGAPAFDGLQIGTISPILAFLVAVIWRYRDRAWVAATALALLVLTKIFLWPVGVWLLATRRFKSVAIAAAITASAVLLSALPVGFGALTGYPALLKVVSSFEATASLSLVSLGAAATGSDAVGYALSFAVGGLLLCGIVWSGWKGHEDSRAFRLSVLASLALTPIVWNHYLALLFVPLALTRPRFSPIWLGTAWVLGAVATTMRGGALAFVIALVWVVVLAQAGVGAQPRAGRRFARGGLLAFALLLCSALVGVLVAVLPVVPAVASLRPPVRSSAASGTADLRLLRDRRICVRAWTAGVRVPAFARVIEPGRGTVLVTVPLHRSEACGHYPRSAETRNVADEFAKRRVRLEVRIVSGTFDETLLSGAVLRLEDSKSVRPSS